MQPAGPDAFHHNMGCQKCLNICQAVTAVSWTSIGGKKNDPYESSTTEGILGFILAISMKDQFSYHKKKLLSSLRTIFMLISGSASDFYKIFNTVGKMTLLSSSPIVPKFEGRTTFVVLFVFYSSVSPWRMSNLNQD